MENTEMDKLELDVEELAALPKAGTLLVDMRDDTAVAYGTLPGSSHRKQDELLADGEELCGYDRVVLCCARGEYSLDAAEELRARGVRAYSLRGGYLSWLSWKIRQDEEEEEAGRQAQIEESIRKRFHKPLLSRFAKAVRDYELIRDGDRIAVCISGGKDSMLMAKLFQELQRHRKMNFDLVFLIMDPGYSPANRRLIEHNAKKLGIPVTVFESQIFDIVYEEEKSPCYLCARMRRGYLYSKAQELGCNKIALGHHYDDVIETVLMGMLYGGQVQSMMPKLHSTNFPGMELIRPMYLIREDDIKRWRDENDLQFIQCACHFTDTCTTCTPDGRTVSKRMEVKNLIRELKKTNPFVEANIFRSVENVNLDTVPAWKQNGVRHSFLDGYEDEKERKC